MSSSENQIRDGFFRRTGKKISALLKRFRAFVERHRWLMIFYKLTVAAIGAIIIIAGIVMLVLPGPGWLTIFFGFAVLGTEFVWARKTISWLRKQLAIIVDRLRRYRESKKAKKEEGPQGKS